MWRDTSVAGEASQQPKQVEAGQQHGDIYADLYYPLPN